MECRYVLLFDSRGYARLIQEPDRRIYFDSIFVKETHRRRGIASELLRFAICYFGRYPELDIRRQSLVAQHIAARFGYVRIAESERYISCDLWVHSSCDAPQCQSVFGVQSLRTYDGTSRKTVVYYLKSINGAAYPLLPSDGCRSGSMKFDCK
ncbi:MAG: GNAT family N-acetyltransferase [Kiloniellaceae bacterium]